MPLLLEIHQEERLSSSARRRNLRVVWTARSHARRGPLRASSIGALGAARPWSDPEISRVVQSFRIFVRLECIIRFTLIRRFNQLARFMRRLLTAAMCIQVARQTRQASARSVAVAVSSEPVAVAVSVSVAVAVRSFGSLSVVPSELCPLRPDVVATSGITRKAALRILEK